MGRLSVGDDNHNRNTTSGRTLDMPRKRTKTSTVTTSRWTIDDEDDADDDTQLSEWIKSTSRIVHANIRASRKGKKPRTTRYTEEDDEVEVLLASSGSYFLNGIEHKQFASWLGSDAQDDASYDAPDVPSIQDDNPTVKEDSDGYSDASSDYNMEVDAPNVHDLKDFNAETQDKVSPIFLSYLCLH